MKNIFKSSKLFIEKTKPPVRWKVPVIILTATLISLGIYTIYVSKAWSYISDNPKTCVNCHVMGSQYATWNHSSHRERATCNDCHVPQDNLFSKYFFKAKDGLNHSRLFITRAEKQVAKISEEAKHVVKKNCITCHAHLLDQSKLIAKTRGKYVPHNTDRDCWECHRDVPHTRIHSLTTTPNATVPVPESPVPDWLKNITKD